MHSLKQNIVASQVTFIQELASFDIYLCHQIMTDLELDRYYGTMTVLIQLTTEHRD